MVIHICVGSSCHLKGSADIVEKLQNYIEARGLQNEISLVGSFCIGKCNREGVTVQVDDDIYTGVTLQNFNEFFTNNILSKLG